jgi:hypothetical protein
MVKNMLVDLQTNTGMFVKGCNTNFEQSLLDQSGVGTIRKNLATDDYISNCFNRY